MTEYRFRVEGLPPSYNKHFQIAWGLKECWLSPEAHAFKNRVKMSMSPVELQGRVNMEVEYHADWYYKNGKIRKIDLQNLDKLLYDAVFEKLGIDDSLVWERQEKKVQSDEEYTVVTVRTLSD